MSLYLEEFGKNFYRKINVNIYKDYGAFYRFFSKVTIPIATSASNSSKPGCSGRVGSGTSVLLGLGVGVGVGMGVDEGTGVVLC